MNMKQLLYVVPISASFLFASCGGGGEHDHAMMDQHKAMMAADSSAKAVMAAREEGCKAIFAMFESGNTDGIENYIAENMVEHTPMPGITSTGIQALKDMVAMHHGAFPDTKDTPISFAHNGDIMMVHFNMKGTNTGAMGDMPATGKAIDVTGVDVIRFEGDKAVEHWGYAEEMKMMTQLGMMPAPGEKTDAKKKM